MASSVGSDVFAFLALLVVSTLVLLLLRHYLPLRSTPAYLLVPVFLALALPCSIILLVPIDLASSSGTDTQGVRGIWLPERVILVAWRISYWLTFVLTWVVLPLLGEYLDSGYREPKDRFVYSLRSNGRYQLIALGTGILAAVYFFLQNGFHGPTVKALVIALAYAWGLVLAIYLMGHGLVSIPRGLFRNASVSGRLRRLQAQAPKLHERLQEAEEELGTVEAQVARLHQRKSGVGPDLRDWIEELAEISSEQPYTSLGRQGYSTASGTPTVVTNRYLAEVGRKLKRARHKRIRFVLEWQYLVQQATRLQTILDAASSQRLQFEQQEQGRKTLLSRSWLTPLMRYHLHANILPAFRMILGATLSLASIALIWSELVHMVGNSKLSLVGLTVVHYPGSSRGEIGFSGQVIASAWLLYMCIAALNSMSEVKVWGNRALVKRQTYPESACWYSLQVARLTVPLSFNFITMMQPNIYQGTAFFAFLGKLIDLTPLSSGFSDYFPIFILVPVCATLFNLYGKVKNVIGFGVLEDESEENTSGLGTGGWREGRALIERGLQNSDVRVGFAGTTNARPYTDNRTSLDDRPPTRTSLLPVTADTTSTSAPRSRVAEQGPEDDSARSFYQDFGERVRNTFDTVDRPQWLQSMGENMKKPRWMGGDGQDGGRSNVLGRLFGGGESSRGLRL